MLELPDAMLGAADTANVPMTITALTRSLAHARFGDVVLFTHEPPDEELPFRTEIIPSLRSRDDYSHFVVTRLGELTTRKFNLLVQWDGFIVQPAAWRSEFLRYDYIGARWPWHRDGMDVGNGGFCLRSRKLLARVAAEPRADSTPDDEMICRVLRPRLEKEGFRFAPAPVADRFAYERMLPNVETFGFHGLFNMCVMLATPGWCVWRSRVPSISSEARNGRKPRYSTPIFGNFRKQGPSSAGCAATSRQRRSSGNSLSLCPSAKRRSAILYDLWSGSFEHHQVARPVRRHTPACDPSHPGVPGCFRASRDSRRICAAIRSARAARRFLENGRNTWRTRIAPSARTWA